MRRSLSILASSFLLAAVALPVGAATFKSGDSLSLTVPVSDDLYAAGGMVEVSERVEGDLLVGGGNVTVTGDVTGDVAVGAGNARIRANVGDDVRVGGGQVEIRGTIGDDLVVAGGQVEIDRETVVNGDVIVMGGMLTVNGTIKGNLRAMGGQLILRGTVEGSADIRMDDVKLEGLIAKDAVLVATKLKAEPNARINGNLEYWLKDGETALPAGLVQGTTRYNAELKPTHERVEKGVAGALVAAFVGFQLFSFLSAALVILVLLLVTRTYFVDTAHELRQRPGRSAWYGVLYFILTPVFAILCFITLVGFPIGIVLIVMYGLTFLFLRVLCAMVLARWVELHRGAKWSRSMTFLWTLLMYVALKLISWVPVIGWMVALAIAVLCVGALMTVKYQRFLKVR